MMFEEKRKQFCPEHQRVYICRQGDEVICCAFNCDWHVTSKRETDKHIVTLGDLKKVYNGI